MWFLLGLLYLLKLCPSSGKNLVSERDPSLPLTSCRFCGCGIYTPDTSPHFQDSAADTWFCQVSADAFGWKRPAQLSKRFANIYSNMCRPLYYLVVVFTCSSSHCYAFLLEGNAAYRKSKWMWSANKTIWAHMKSLLKNTDHCLWYSGCLKSDRNIELNLESRLDRVS